MERISFNDNVNVNSRIESHNVNDNVKYTNKHAKSKKVDDIADQLVTIFNNPQGRRYYCKIAWKLPESVIYQNVEQTRAEGVSDPKKLFTFLCQRVLQ